MSAYYNEWNPQKAQWLRELMDAGLIASGVIDTRDIREVRAHEIKGFKQYHYCAGIGGWPLAFRLAGWADDRPVRSVSLPCQPYSIVGRGKGFEDERDLWPLWWREQTEFIDLPLFGEQVADAVGYGWLDRAFDDMEAVGYTCTAVAVPACSVGLPHERERVLFVGNADSPRLEGHARDEREIIKRPVESGHICAADILGSADFVPDIHGNRRLVKSGAPLLDHGLSAGMARLCAEGFGDAIVPPLVAEFIKAAAIAIT
jgi:DNA (cytosine-5)-methyltransferase 1